MGLMLFNKVRVIKGLGLLYVFFTLWLTITGDYYDYANMIWIAIILGFCFAIPHVRRRMARKLLNEKTGLNVLFLRPAYHVTKGKGYLAINEEAVLFVKRSDIYQFHISDVTYMQWGNYGTGEFETTHHDHTSTTHEKTLPIFSIEGKDFAHTWVLRSTADTKTCRKLMEKHGDFTTDLQRYKI